MADNELLKTLLHECGRLKQSEWSARLKMLSEDERARLIQRLESDRRLQDSGNNEFLSNTDVDKPMPEDAIDPTEVAQSTLRKGESSELPTAANAYEQIGDYRILNIIAVHGQGAVYRANHPHLNRQVVIKVSKNQVDQAHQEHVLSEGRALASLSHPNLAQVYDLQLDHGRPYLVMEYIEGRNLCDQLKDQPVQTNEAADLVATLARAIHHAHSVGIVHQDLKPANIVIRANDGMPKIIDFGLARAKNVYAEQALLDTYGGTIAYMAPEQAKQLKSLRQGNSTIENDERVDIFALGAILYELLSGKRLYKFNGSVEGLDLAAECEFDSKALDDAPEYLRSACLKALAKNPADRWISATQFADALQQPTQPSFAYSRLLIPATIGCILLFASWWFAFGRNNSRAEKQARQPTQENFANRLPTNNPDELISGVRFSHFANSGDAGNIGRLFENGPVQEDDDLRIEARFDEATYCFLFALNPDGALQLCYPEGDEEAWDRVQTQPILHLQYPADESLGFPFTDGAGQQAFVLIRSQQPLPSFREWVAAAGNMQNALAKTTGKWIWQNATVRPAINSRGNNTRGAPRKLRGYEPFDVVMKAIQNSNSDQDVSGLVFPVVPR